MTEDVNKKKPKATLIKHRKVDGASKADKRKVVVVKKKPPIKNAPSQEPAPLTSVETQSAAAAGKQASVKKKPKTANDEKSAKSAEEIKVQTASTASETLEAKAPAGKKTNKKERNGDNAVKAAPAKKQAEKAPAEKAANPERKTVSFERIDSGKDTVASPPRGSGGREGVQILETRRMGGRAGVVAGRRMDGVFPHSGSDRKPSTGPPQGRSGGYHRQGHRPGGYNRGNSGGRPGMGPSKSNQPGGGRPGAGSRPSGDRAGGFRRSSPDRPGSAGRPAGRSTGRSDGFTPPTAPPAVNRGKKFYKAKKTYERHKEQEKLYQYSKKKQVIQTNPVPKRIDIMEVITVSALARKMNLRASDLISKLMGMGMMVTINQQIDADTAKILADDYGCTVNIVSLYDETIIASDKDDDSVFEQRPPIVTVMGHVDHGKTKLLDVIRDADVIAGEHGGITQHIGAYMVHTKEGNITFLDTPGHSAFTMMRVRGAQITDLVVLVVAANDGVMPRTIEAIQHAKAADAPIIVAINKMDLPDANPERVKQQLSEYDLMPEDWGGSTQFVEISALHGEGIDALLATLILEAEMLELKADWNCRAEGKIIESKVDPGRGVVATVLVENGTLSIGDSFVAGIFHGKVRAMFDDNGKPVKQATPAMPVEILGFSGVPGAGDPFQVTPNEKEARQYGSKRQELRKMETARNVKKITLDNLYDSIQDGDVQELKVIIKGDVHGSVEALQTTLEQLSTDEIRLVCIRAAAGAIIEDDVNLAAASDAIIIGFHVRPTARVLTAAEKENVEIRRYNVIFEAVEDIRAAMEGLLSPDFEEVAVGRAEVRETFNVPKIGTIAGCMISSGVITRKSKVHLLRDGAVVHTGHLTSLKRFKDDVKEVKEGYECGIGLEQFSDIQAGDVLEVFETREITKKLGDSERDE